MSLPHSAGDGEDEDAGDAPVLLVPGYMPHSQQYPWLYVSRRFRTPCVLHPQLHGHPQELRQLKGNRFWPPNQVQTRAHDACVKEAQKRAVATAAAAPQPQVHAERGPFKRAVKRPLKYLESDSATPSDVRPDPLLALTPLRRSVQSVGAAALVWQQQDYATLRGLAGAAALARAIAALSAPAPTRLLSGRTGQQTLLGAQGWASLCDDVESLCRRACDAVGVAHSALFFIEPKRLTSLPGEGEQAVHWDCAYAYDTPPSTITFLLHCSEGSGIESTALPLYCARDCILATRPRDAVAFGSLHMRTTSARRAQLQAAVPLLDKQQFHRVAARIGDVTLCRQSVPHYGTRNSSSGNRVVMFAMLSASRARAQDNYQFFRWQFIAEAFGRESLEYAKALVAGKEFESVERFREADERSWREANQLLEKFGLLRLYYGEGEQTQWNNEQEQAAAEQRNKKEKRRGAGVAAAAAAAASSATAFATVCVPAADAKRE